MKTTWKRIHKYNKLPSENQLVNITNGIDVWVKRWSSEEWLPICENPEKNEPYWFATIPEPPLVKRRKWENFLKDLDTSDKSVIYDLLESEHIKNDIITVLENNNIELSEEKLKQCIDIAVSRKGWDADKGYWENIAFTIQLIKGD